MRRTTMFLIAAVSGWTVLTCSPAVADTTVTARLSPVNGSEVRGSATLTERDDGSLTVVIHASGLVPGQPHAQHIHGSVEGGHFMCPSEADDRDGDGVITNEEATGEYGTIFMPLTTHGDTSPRSGLSRMPVADSQGRVDFRRTFAPNLVPDELPGQLSHVHVVIHGIDANGNDRYDLKGLGVSTFARNLGIPGVPEEATDPAACGVVTGAAAPVAPMGGVETGGGTPSDDGGALRMTTGAGLLTAAMLVALGLTRIASRRRSHG